jgi:hypothetical protein
MKFDVVIGNPPFSDSAKESENSTIRTPGSNLAKKFMLKSIELSNCYIAMILPYSNRNYNDSISKKYQNAGLYKINRIKFKNIAQTIGVYFFNKLELVNKINNEFDTNLPIQNNNITKFYHTKTGSISRNQYEHLLYDHGYYKIYLSVSIIKYTNDINIINKLNDRTFGNWRVIINRNSNRNNIGPITIAQPNDYLGQNVQAFIVNNEKEALILRDYLSQPSINEIMNKVKVSIVNSKKYLKYIESPF